MKLFLSITLSLLFMGSELFGQQKRFSFGVKAGVNFSNAKEFTNDYTHGGNPKAKWGYQVGFSTDYSVTNSVYFQSGLSLTTKGTRHQGAEIWIGSTTPPTTFWESTTNQVYLQLPLLLGYKINLSNLAKMRVNAGPYIAYGIGGKEIIKEKTIPASVRDDKRFTSDTFGKDYRRYSPYNLKRQDYGISLGLGIDYKKVVLSFDYQVGLLNVAEANERDTAPLPVDYRNRNLSLIVGYIF
ncbi:porin family protein [Spirosoma endbachense]|uniref:Outer membrane beta-barrel protein n=1 Tax=Spirosoma endbachense TaxID=2666025 RepID=A0A6P1W4U2_9BACT|nr:porin family protein [Spirosoma endbachense]QHV99019.1 outer membrane beta-barrel protein [Spirosoma endbachense]